MWAQAPQNNESEGPKIQETEEIGNERKKKIIE